MILYRDNKFVICEDFDELDLVGFHCELLNNEFCYYELEEMTKNSDLSNILEMALNSQVDIMIEKNGKLSIDSKDYGYTDKYYDNIIELINDMAIVEDFYGVENTDVFVEIEENIIKIAMNKLLHKRFSTIEEVCIELKNMDKENICSVHLVQEEEEKDFDLKTDDFLIGNVNNQFDIQLFYIKDNDNHYYITETMVLGEYFE